MPVKDFLKFVFNTPGKKKLPLNYNLQQKWILKSKFLGFFFLLIPILSTALINILNYTYCTGLSYTFPPVDIVNVLTRFDELPSHSYDEVFEQTFWYDNKLLHGTLKGAYLLKEDAYLERIADCTIVVEPTLNWTPHQISLSLKEGFFNFTENKLVLDETTVSHLISKSTSNNGNYFDFTRRSKSEDYTQNFIRQYLYAIFYITSVSPSDYNVDSLIFPFFMTRIGNFGVFILSASALMSLVLFETRIRGKYEWPCHTANTVLLIISFTSSVIFLFLKLVFSVIIDYKFPTTKYHIVNLICAAEIVAFAFFAATYIRKYIDRYRELREDDAIKKIMSGFEPSPEHLLQTSSTYSSDHDGKEEKPNDVENDFLGNADEDEDEDEEENKKLFTIESSMSLDPMKKRNSAFTEIQATIYPENKVPSTAIQSRVPRIQLPARNYTAPPLNIREGNIESKRLELEELDENIKHTEEEFDKDAIEFEKPVMNEDKVEKSNPYSTPTSFVQIKSGNDDRKDSSIFKEDLGMS